MPWTGTEKYTYITRKDLYLCHKDGTEQIMEWGGIMQGVKYGREKRKYRTDM